MSLAPSGLKVLLAEDDFTVALDLEQTLCRFGCLVLGPVTSCLEGMAVLQRERPDVALLDVELTDGWVTPLAWAMANMKVPFALLTGHHSSQLDGLLRTVPCLDKPFDHHQIKQLLQRLASMKLAA